MQLANSVVLAVSSYKMFPMHLNIMLTLMAFVNAAKKCILMRQRLAFNEVLLGGCCFLCI